jgi:hypothetical protein
MCHGSAPTVVSDDRRGRNLGLSRFRPVQKVGGSCVHGLGPPRFNPSRANCATCAHQSPQTADLDRVPKYVPTSANLRVPGDTSEHLRARKTGGSHLPGRLAMQKVEGSSPFIRFRETDCKWGEQEVRPRFHRPVRAPPTCAARSVAATLRSPRRPRKMPRYRARRHQSPSLRTPASSKPRW